MLIIPNHNNPPLDARLKVTWSNVNDQLKLFSRFTDEHIQQSK